MEAGKQGWVDGLMESEIEKTLFFICAKTTAALFGNLKVSCLAPAAFLPSVLVPEEGTKKFFPQRFVRFSAIFAASHVHTYAYIDDGGGTGR